MRVATIFWIAALLCTVGVWAEDGPADINNAPHLISTALRKMGKGIHRILHHNKDGQANTPMFQFTGTRINTSQTLQELEEGIDDVAMSIEDWVATTSRKDKATKESNAHDAVLARQEVLKLKHATVRVQNASRMRSAPKAAEIARLQKIRDQLNAEIRARMPPPPTAPPKRDLPSGNIHALAKYLWAPQRDANPPQKPTAPPQVVAEPKNSSQMQEKAHAPITSKEVADEVMRKQKEALKEEQQKSEMVAEAARNATLAALKDKKVKMSRKLRGYLRMPTAPPPKTVEQRKEQRVSVGIPRAHLLAAEDILVRMNESAETEIDKISAESSALVAQGNSSMVVKHAVPPAGLAPAKAATSALQLSKFWKIAKDSTNVWPWIKGGVHM